MPQFYIHDGKSQLGPFSLDELKAKKLAQETPIWFEGLGQWSIVANIPELKGIVTKSTPPPFIDSVNVKDTHVDQKGYLSAMEEYFPEREKSFKIPLIVSGIILSIIVIFWIVNRNSQHNSTISGLQRQISEQKAENEKIKFEEQLKEDEKTKENEALLKKNLAYRTNWEKYIKKDNSRPNIDHTWGGISAFNTYVINETDYIIEQVDLYVQYIRKNGELWQHKTISFFNVPPKSHETEVAPSSAGGVEIKVEIQKIICKKMQFCYPIYSGNQQDPFFCK